MNNVTTKYSNYSIITFCILIIIGMLYVYLPNPYLWYDEAGQFFISQGLNHYSPPFSPVGNVLDVIQNNREYNMDPGGFSVILHFWQKISTSYLFLRLLPALFFGGFSYFLFLISKRETDSRILAFVIATLPFILPVFTNRITELRAYPMEMMGIILSVWLLMCYDNRWGYKQLLTFSLIQIVFSTSRYGYVIAAFGVSLYLLAILYKENSINAFLKKAVVYGLPLTSGVTIIYFGMMCYQNENAGQMTYAVYLSNSALVLLYPMSILFYIIILSFFYKLSKKQHVPIIHTLALIVGSIYFVLSVFGLYPWEMHRTISAFTLFVFVIIIDVFKYIKHSCNGKIHSFCFLILFFSLIVWGGLYIFIHENKTEKQIVEYNSFVNNYKFKKIWVEATLNPIIRYQYEYATLSPYIRNHDYPNKMHLVDGGKHSFSANNEVDTISGNGDYDVIWILDEVMPKYCKRIDGYSHLYLHLKSLPSR